MENQESNLNENNSSTAVLENHSTEIASGANESKLVNEKKYFQQIKI